MFWTAFVWGLGVTVGGSFGLMLFVVLYAGWQWMTQTKAAKHLAEYHGHSMQKIEDRIATIIKTAERHEDSIEVNASKEKVI